MRRPDADEDDAAPREHPIVKITFPEDVGALRLQLERVTRERDAKAVEVVRLEGERQSLAGALRFATRVIEIRTQQVRDLTAFRDQVEGVVERLEVAT